MAASAAEAWEPEFSEKITLLAALHCPYAQRTWIALSAKGVPYSTVIVDLANKPPWFFRYNPNGRVPTLVYRDKEGVHTVYESLICNEFIHELPGPALLPEHPAKRASARILLDHFANATCDAFSAVMFSRDPEALPGKIESLTKQLQWLEEQVDETGPYFLGSSFTLLDAAITPWLLRLPILEQTREFSVMGTLPKLAKWISFVKEDPIVTASYCKTSPDMPYEEDMKNEMLKYASVSTSK